MKPGKKSNKQLSEIEENLCKILLTYIRMLVEKCFEKQKIKIRNRYGPKPVLLNVQGTRALWSLGTRCTKHQQPLL